MARGLRSVNRFSLNLLRRNHKPTLLHPPSPNVFLKLCSCPGSPATRRCRARMLKSARVNCSCHQFEIQRQKPRSPTSGAAEQSVMSRAPGPGAFGRAAELQGLPSVSIRGPPCSCGALRCGLQRAGLDSCSLHAPSRCYEGRAFTLK